MKTGFLEYVIKSRRLFEICPHIAAAGNFAKVAYMTESNDLLPKPKRMREAYRQLAMHLNGPAKDAYERVMSGEPPTVVPTV